jgi:ribosomal protein L37AE/L43A
MENPRYRIERFDALLRNLLAWQLVSNDDPGGDGGWHLVPDAQRRLDELNRSSALPDAERLVYLDHRCADCHQRMPTRSRQGIFLCDACLTRRTVQGTAAVADPAAVAGAKRSRRGVSRAAVLRPGLGAPSEGSGGAS